MICDTPQISFEGLDQKRLERAEPVTCLWRYSTPAVVRCGFVSFRVGTSLLASSEYSDLSCGSIKRG